MTETVWSIKIAIAPENLRHMQPDQYGAFVAWLMVLPCFQAVTVTAKSIEVSFESAIETFEDIAKIQKEIEFFINENPHPCPCGCGAYIALSPCFRQMENRLSGEMTQEEHNLVKNGAKIAAIKEIRQRTGLGLKDAKDIVDRAYPPTYR